METRNIKRPADLRAEFEDCARGGSPAQEIRQGYEEISTGQIQISQGFSKCSAFLLINTADGVTLYKHAGPRATEVFMGGGDQGVNFQENYELFMAHAAKHGQRIIVQPVYGGSSAERTYLIQDVQRRGEKEGIAVEVRVPLRVESEPYKWHMSYNPREAYVVIKRHIVDAKDSLYEQHFIPGPDPASFDSASAQEIGHQLESIARRQEIKYDIRASICSSDSERLESVLSAAADFLGERELQRILGARLDSDWEIPREICLNTFHRQSEGRNKNPQENTIHTLEVLSRFDCQDDVMRRRYAAAILDCAELATAEAARDCALAAADRLKSRIADARSVAYLERTATDVLKFWRAPRAQMA